MGLLIIYVIYSIPICIALSFIGAYPRPVSVVGLCIAFVGKLGIRPSAFLAALLRSLSIVSSCLSVNMPKWVAWYFDRSSWSITCFFLLGDGSLFVRALARCLTSVVTCFRWSRKSSIGLMCTPSILHYLFGGRCRMGEPYSNFIVLIWLRSRCVFSLLIGLPYPHSAPLASHFVVSSSSPVYSLNKCSILICIWRFSSVRVVILMSSA